MFSDNDIEAMRGAEAVSSDGAKIGPVGDVYLDDATGQPSWVTVSSGLFGTKTFFVPLHGARLAGEKLTLGFDKVTITEAPRLAEDEHLGADEEQRLIAHYGIGRDELVDGQSVAMAEAQDDTTSPEASLGAESVVTAPDADVERFESEHDIDEAETQISGASASQDQAADETAKSVESDEASEVVLGDGLADTDGTELRYAESITDSARDAAAKADPLRDGSFAGDATKASLIDTPRLDGDDETRERDGL